MVVGSEKPDEQRTFLNKIILFLLTETYFQFIAMYAFLSEKYIKTQRVLRISLVEFGMRFLKRQTLLLLV